MELTIEHIDLLAPISPLSLLLVQKQAARWKAATPELLTGAHLYLNIAKSGFPISWLPRRYEDKCSRISKFFWPRTYSFAIYLLGKIW